MLESFNDNLAIKVIDWGSAKIMKKKLKMNSILGTPHFMAP